ncbi:iron hydrogenase [Candidatus Parcubacteria bacterium]|nr:MAG: iron hydrogenase [Candidatus Parcubacteria bacterium]
MAKAKTLTLNNSQVKTMVQFAALLGIATVLPLFHQQWLTGPMVNAVLYVAVVLLGTQNAIVLGLLPSTIALAVGLLPPILAPMIPFIIISNTIMVVSFAALKEKNYWLGIIGSSIVKFVFLWSTSYIVVNLLLKKELANTVSAMMAWPQLFTAIVGGIIAYVFLKSIKKI